MSKAENIFMKIAGKYITEDDIILGKMMSAPGLKYKDKVFAFFTKEQAMGFRLGEEFDTNKAGLKNPRPLSPFKTKPPLKGWVIVDYEEHTHWEHLTENALNYTQTL